MRSASWLAIQVLRALPRTRLSQAVGRLCDRPLPANISRAIEHAYTRVYGVDMTDVTPHHGAYPTIDAFFTRSLRAGARPISQSPVVSPADGRVVAIGRIEPEAHFRVKAQDYAADELIDRRTGGSLCRRLVRRRISGAARLSSRPCAR
jgi:phosphatidylserine decarboxylase